jgi:threonyl-tRNA synthetase
MQFIIESRAKVQTDDTVTLEDMKASLSEEDKSNIGTGAEIGGFNDVGKLIAIEYLECQSSVEEAKTEKHTKIDLTLFFKDREDANAAADHLREAYETVGVESKSYVGGHFFVMPDYEGEVK